MERTQCLVPLRLLVIAVLFGAWPERAVAVDPPKLRELRVQRVGQTTYFHVGFERPAGMAQPAPEPARLVPQDDKAHAVYARRNTTGPTVPQAGNRLLALPPELPRPQPTDEPPRAGNQPAPVPVPVVGLEFVGKCEGKGKAALLLLYLKEKAGAAHWIQIPVELDFDQAKKVPAAANAPPRQPKQPPGRDDLEGLWALAQADSFAALAASAPDFSFFSFAREATNRKYGLASQDVGIPLPLYREGNSSPLPVSAAYETTTGAAAIAESLQRDRMIGGNLRDKSERTINLSAVPGIDIAEHPWQKMMGDKKPAPEPLAQLVPDDNYYVRFRNISKFLEMNELVEQWGTNLIRAYEVKSHDYQLKQRYERQLCLRSSDLARTLGPLVVRGLAITGSDAYFREGSDVTIIFDVRDRTLFLAAVEPFLDEARKEWGDRLRQSKDTYHDVAIEGFVTPQREVSLQRATLGDFVIYSNSPAGVRRVLDSKQGRHKALADSLDFQYMRTIFRADEAEDGFAFLSDPFIRQLVGPASKIKEKRRLEAITSLTMATNNALFTAWEAGKLPSAAAASILKPEELYTPEGKGVTWDTSRNQALSEVYGTLQFATPLIELPIDRVTETEQRDYLQFRGEYMGLWRRYFDPVGMRLALNDQQVRIETYILPLIKNTEYNELRSRTGDGTVPLETNGFSPRTVLQIVSHISPNAPERGQLQQALTALGVLGNNKGLDWLGDWFFVRLDDSDVYAKIAQRVDQPHGNGTEVPKPLPQENEIAEDIELAFSAPLTVGIGIRNPLLFAGVLTALRATVNTAAPGVVTWAPLDPDYKGVSIVRIQALSGQAVGLLQNPNRKEPFQPALYYTVIEGGFYISLRQDCIQDVIDHILARKEGKLPKLETVPVNASLYLSPRAATKTKEFVKFTLQQQVQAQVLGNTPLWYALYRSRLLAPDATEEVCRTVAMHYFGFVPVSADGTSYRYSVKTDEVVHNGQRHAAETPVERLLDQFQTLRADLRFREDGIQTVLTIARKR
jgi:hypothetical protein